MKRAMCVVLCVVLTLLLCFAAVGCRKQEKGENVLGDYQVTVKDHRVAKDAEGKDVVVFTFSFTNHGEESMSFYAAMLVEAYQDDMGLMECVDSEIEGYDEDTMMRNIKKDATIDVQMAFELDNTTSEVTLEISEMFTFSEDKIVKSFPL